MIRVELDITDGMIVNGEQHKTIIELFIPEMDDLEKCNKTCKSYGNGFTLSCPFENCMYHEYNREYHVIWSKKMALQEVGADAVNDRIGGW